MRGTCRRRAVRRGDGEAVTASAAPNAHPWEPGPGPVEVAAVLMDGMDLVVLGLGGRTVPATRARAVVARARQRGCTLLVTDGDWQGASARLDAHVSGYEIAGGRDGVPTPGCGRISRVRLAMRAKGRSVGHPARAVGG